MAKYKAWASGDQVLAADLLDFIQKNVVIPCESQAEVTALPAREGMTAYEKQNDKLLVNSGGATSGWTAPWNMPWGLIAYATGGGASASIGAPTTASVVTTNSNFPTITYPLVPAGGASAGAASAVFNGAITATNTQNRKLSVSVDVVLENTSTTANRDIVAVLYAGSAATPTTPITFSRVRSNAVALGATGAVRETLNLQGSILSTSATTYLRLALYQSTSDTSTLSITYVNASVNDVGPNGAPV